MQLTPVGTRALVLARNGGSASITSYLGAPGPRGADGSNVLPTDTAISNAINDGASATSAALKASIAALASTRMDVAAVVSANGALVVDQHNPVDASGGNRTMTLADPTAHGQYVTVSKRDSSLNTVTINIAHLRDGGASSITLTGQYEAIGLLAKADGTWWPVVDHKTKKQLDAAYSGPGVSLAKYLPLGNTGSGLVAAAFASAATEAGVGGTIFIPKYMGDYTLDAPVTLERVGIKSDGATINVTSLGAGVAALTITASSATSSSKTYEGFRLLGPGARSLGVKTANCDGIKITGQAKPFFNDVNIEQFDSGEILHNDVGHIYHRNVVIANNYYGVYCTKNTFDYYYSDSLINGNTFANMATPADQGFAAMRLTNVHIGFAPYGIYQEPTPANQGKPKVFLQDVTLDGARFEAIGNAAIFTEAQQDATNASITSDLVIRFPGFSWNATYKIAARNKDYAIVLSQTDRLIEITMGANPFTAGDVNVYRVKLGGSAAFMLRGVPGVQVATTQVTTDSGNSNVLAFAAPLANGSSPSFAQVDLTTSTGYLRWSGNNTRIGGDGTTVYVDSTGGCTWRDSDNSYATRMLLTDTKLEVSAAHTIRSGRNVTGSRPSASTVGAGAMFYDTTLSKPIWSDGTVWRDAAGTAV